LLNEAETQLVDRGLRRPQAEAILAATRAVPEENGAWRQGGRGLALFLAQDFQRAFHFSRELEPAVFVDDRFHLRPMLPLIDDEQRFFVLALTQDRVRLLEGDADGLHEVAVPGLPENLHAALNASASGRGAPAPASESSQPQVVLQGEHGQSRAAKDDVQLFLRRVATAVDKFLAGERAPLVLATGIDNVPLWREASKYLHLVDDFVSGNPHDLTRPQLHAKAWALAEPALRRRRQWLHDRLLNAQSAGKASLDLQTVVPAAVGGRVEALFIDCSLPRWGRYDPAHHRAEVHEQPQSGDEDLVERAAAETLRHCGEVYAANLGDGNAARALLRW